MWGVRLMIVEFEGEKGLLMEVAFDIIKRDAGKGGARRGVLQHRGCDREGKEASRGIENTQAWACRWHQTHQKDPVASTTTHPPPTSQKGRQRATQINHQKRSGSRHPGCRLRSTVGGDDSAIPVRRQEHPLLFCWKQGYPGESMRNKAASSGCRHNF